MAIELYELKRNLEISEWCFSFFDLKMVKNPIDQFDRNGQVGTARQSTFRSSSSFFPKFSSNQKQRSKPSSNFFKWLDLF